MPRPVRIEYDHAFFHVMKRGRGRQWIFHSDTSYHTLMDTLADAHERFGLVIHGYCLMGPIITISSFKTPQLFMENGAILHTPWILQMKNAKISGRHVHAKGLNVIESHGVDQTHLFTKTVFQHLPQNQPIPLNSKTYLQA